MMLSDDAVSYNSSKQLLKISREEHIGRGGATSVGDQIGANVVVEAPQMFSRGDGGGLLMAEHGEDGGGGESADELFLDVESQPQQKLLKSMTSGSSSTARSKRSHQNLPYPKRVQLRIGGGHSAQRKANRRDNIQLSGTAKQKFSTATSMPMSALKQRVSGGKSGGESKASILIAGNNNNNNNLLEKAPRPKSNQMYLITTLLPGGSSASQQQNGGYSRASSAERQLQNWGYGMQPLPNMINRMLPKELILRMFSFLDIVSLCRCAQVSRFWNRLAMDGSNWQDVDLFSFQRDVKAYVVENLAKRCGGFLKELSLKGCENIQDSAMRSFALKCPNIERLTLSRCKLITDATCEYIGRYCHKLTVLDLENCPAITDLTCKFISEGLKQLDTLNLSWCQQITDLGIGYIARGCPNLSALSCKGCNGISPLCFSQLKMQQLRKLSLFSCPNVLDETVAHIASQCNKLDFLSLSSCREITDQALLAIAHGCPKIRTLELADCQNLTDTGFIALAKNCHEIERMDLEECVLITDTTLLHLKTGCPNLSSLSLSHCENLTDNGLFELCNSHKDCLQILELDNCPNITDSALEYMKNMKILERVDLYDCQAITKDAIKQFKKIRPEVDVHAYFAPATPPTQPPPARRGICRCCAII